jgi:ribosomal protein S15P/S13E
MKKNKKDASGKEKLKTYSQDRRKILKFVQKLRKVKRVNRGL